MIGTEMNKETRTTAAPTTDRSRRTRRKARAKDRSPTPKNMRFMNAKLANAARFRRPPIPILKTRTT